MMRKRLRLWKVWENCCGETYLSLLNKKKVSERCAKVAREWWEVWKRTMKMVCTWRARARAPVFIEMWSCFLERKRDKVCEIEGIWSSLLSSHDSERYGLK